jgi:hypothetical protein
VYNFIAPSPNQFFDRNFALEKKTPQAFRVRGSSRELSSSAQTPAPVAVYYGQEGEAVGVHLSLMKKQSANDPGKAQSLSMP